MSQHRKRGGKMKSVSHPNGTIVTPYIGNITPVEITEYNEDGSYMARPIGSDIPKRYVRRTLFVREDFPSSEENQKS